MKAGSHLERLSERLSRLPGIGRRSAERMALRLARDPGGLASDLMAALRDVVANVRCCGRCGNVTTVDEDPCRLCVDPARDGAQLCVVEDASDILTIERAGGYRGRYHALLGKLSPMQGTGPRDIRVEALVRRVEQEGVRELVLALNTDVESDATARYIGELFKDRPVRVTRLAFGLPAGSGIMYADAVTLSRAMKGRQPLE